MTEDQEQKPKSIERITIEEGLKDKLARLTNQANDVLKGMATVTKSDITNFILTAHTDEFTKAELNDLRSQHFSEMRFAQWLATQLKDAHARGEPLSIKQLIDQNLHLMEGSSTSVRKRAKRGRRPGTQDSTGKDQDNRQVQSEERPASIAEHE